MRRSLPCGMLVLDRKGEYIEDTIDQHGNTVFGLHHHPMAAERMVVVSSRDFSRIEKQGRIHAFVRPQFSIRDVEPADLADFLTGLTAPQAELLRDYAHIDRFYEKLLGETQFGAVDNRTWYSDFPGLFNLKANGKKLVKKFEEIAVQEGREALTDEEIG